MLSRMVNGYKGKSVTYIRDKWGAKSRYQGWLTDMKVSL